jgi:transposase
LAAGELRFAFVPSVADERFRDLTRSIEDVRGDLMRARHRLSKFLLRRGQRYGGPGRAWTAAHLRWLRGLSFEDACSQASFADYLAAVELLIARRASLLEALERAVPGSSHALVISRLRCFRGIDTLSAAGLAAEVGDFGRFAKPTLLTGFLGIVPSERTSDVKRRQGSITKAGPPHARRLLVEAAHHYRRRPVIGDTLARRQAGEDPRLIAMAWRAQQRLHQRWQHLRQAGASPPASSRSPAHASSPPSSGRPPLLTDRNTSITPGVLPGRARGTREGPRPSREGSRHYHGQPARRQRPLLDSEPRRTKGLEVTALEYQSDPQSTRLDLPLLPPRKHPASANHTDRDPPQPMTRFTPYQ